MQQVDEAAFVKETDPHIRPALKAQLLLKSHGITDEEYKQILEADKLFRKEEDQMREATGALVPMEVATANDERPHKKDEKRERAEAMAARARRRRDREREQITKMKQRRIEEDMQQWEQKILPRWPEMKHTKTVLEMCQRGIPPSIRGRAWRLLIGNDLNVTMDTFKNLLEKAEVIKQQCETEDVAVEDDELERERFQAEYESIKRQSEMLPSGMRWDDSFEDTSDVEQSTTNVDDETEKGTVDNQDEAQGPNEGWLNPDSPHDRFSDEESDNDRESNFMSQPGAAQGMPRVQTSATEIGETTTNDTPLSPTSEMGKEDTVRLIGVDLPRTFPHLAFFHDGGPMAEGLEKVLQAYACYRPDLGYVQGMSYLAAFLLLYMEPIEAFICLANMLSQDVYFQFYRLQVDEVRQLTGVFDIFFQDNLPLLYQHMQEQGVLSEMFLIDWLLTLYCKVLPLEATARVWDGFLYEGEIHSIRVALGILKYTAPQLRELDFVDIRKHLTRLPDDADEDGLFEAIASIKISRRKFNRMLKELRDEWAAAGKISLTKRQTVQDNTGLFSDRRGSLQSPTSQAEQPPSPTCVIS